MLRPASDYLAGPVVSSFPADAGTVVTWQPLPRSSDDKYSSGVVMS
jgi:hypothetical protein